jgi:hypothetical protein
VSRSSLAVAIGHPSCPLDPRLPADLRSRTCGTAIAYDAAMRFVSLAKACCTLVCAATVVGCGGDIEVRGSTRSNADLGGPIWVLVVDADAFAAGDESPVVALVAQQHEPGDFTVTVETDAETLEVFAIRDNDENRSCSCFDETARARVVVRDAERIDVPVLDVSGSTPCSGLGLPIYCPSYAASF